jgi:hypothetical protein
MCLVFPCWRHENWCAEGRDEVEGRACHCKSTTTSTTTAAFLKLCQASSIALSRLTLTLTGALTMLRSLRYCAPRRPFTPDRLVQTLTYMRSESQILHLRVQSYTLNRPHRKSRTAPRRRPPDLTPDLRTTRQFVSRSPWP